MGSLAPVLPPCPTHMNRSQYSCTPTPQEACSHVFCLWVFLKTKITYFL